MAKKFLKKLVGRLDRNLEGPQANFIEQFRYGHREVLILYSNLPHNTAIRGSIEHGWSPFGPSLGVPKNLRSRYLHLAWSSVNMDRASAKRPENVLPVGAPFLYLLETISKFGLSLEVGESRDYLFLPPHGAENEVPRLEEFILDYKKFYDPKKSSVQLYWTEFLNPRIRRLYENSGFMVTCAGFCGMSLNEGLGFSVRERAISGMGARNLFLLNVLYNLLSHKEIVAGTFGTSTLYAGFLRKPVNLLPVWNSFNTDSNIERDDKRPADFAYYRYLQDEVVSKYFLGLRSCEESFYRYSAQELGANDVLSRGELRNLLLRNSFKISAKSMVSELQDHIYSIFS